MWVAWTIRDGTSVFQVSFMYDKDLELGKWYRSKERKGGEHPFTSFLLNKKWTLEEEFNNHILKFQQVTARSIYYIKVHFDIPGWIDYH